MSATSTITATRPDTNIALGLSVPPHTPHAISVSLPKWRDNVGYEEGEKRVIDSMVSGYPRFFIHLSIQKVRNLNIVGTSHVANVVLWIACGYFRTQIWLERGKVYAIRNEKSCRTLSDVHAGPLSQCPPNQSHHLPRGQRERKDH